MATETQVHSLDKPRVGVAGILRDEGRFLLVRRINPPQADHWAFPGGSLLHGETVDAAIRREMLEEAGLFVEPFGRSWIFEVLPTEAESWHYVLVLRQCWRRGGIEHAGDDAAATGWWTTEDMMAAPERLSRGVMKIAVETLEAAK